MRKSLKLFLLSLVVLTVLIAINRWDVPVTQWLALVFGILGVFSGFVWFVTVAG